jgi:hypothetical protein
MKILGIALVSAVLIAGQLFTPVSAAASSAAMAPDGCGDTYTVQPLDYLAKIARYCGTTVASILALNPQIVNPNIVYTGQVLRLTDSAPVTAWLPTGTYYPSYYPYTTYVGTARVSLSTIWANAGDEVTVYASGFPANSEIDFRVGKQGEEFNTAYDATINSNGAASMIISIPSNAEKGEYWVVQVITTSLKDVVQVTSRPIYISAYNQYTVYTGYARVSLSVTQAKAGGTVTVYASGFPANSEIDFRVSKQGEDFSLAYDGIVNSGGTASKTITIPSSANGGEYWVVTVITTSLRNVVQVTSHTIYITS